MKNKTVNILLTVISTFLVSGLIIFFWPEKLTAQEKCLKEGIPKECEEMEIWECHEYHCHKICNEVNKNDCANKACVLNNKNLQNKLYCLDHLH